jgi:GT2 family glycosyltransferase
VAEDPIPYDAWVRDREQDRLKSPTPRQTRMLHVVMIIDEAPPAETAESFQSLGMQTSARWQLSVVFQEPWRTEVMSLLARSNVIGERYELVERAAGTTNGEMLATGLAAAQGDDVALLFPGDAWPPDAVALLSVSLPAQGVAYADEDVLSADARYLRPRLKPAYSPEFLLHSDYMGRPLAISAGVVARLPAAEALPLEAREHDLSLRACEVASAVRHIPEVLCHRRIARAPMAVDTAEGVRHVNLALARQRSRAEVSPGPAPDTFRLRRTARSIRAVNIIIPFRDEPRFLRACVDSIDRATAGIRPSYILVDNGSVQPETMTLLERLDARVDVQVVRDDRPFNWASLNNAAADRADGDVLVFLNNDIEVRSAGWLDALCAQVERADVGAVGGRLLYPDGRVQHCGVVIGLGGAAGHLFVGLDESASGYLALAVTARECSGVTGACLATRRETFEEHGRFDESLGIDLNDIDYCLRVQRAGLRVLYEPTAELIHHESPSRGTAGDVTDIVHFIDRWKEDILSGDPFLNPQLTRMDSSCALRDPAERDWWQRWYQGLSNM